MKNRVPEDPDIGDKKGSQPKKYHSGLSKSTKEKRDAHFKRGAKMNDDNPAAYTPAPGDKEAKTKPSVHTQKFKKMYGEEVTQKQIQDLEKFADRLLQKFNIDIEFTRHFADRMNDPRNVPEIKISELQKLFKKISRQKGKDIRQNPDTEAVLKDIQSDLNLPVVINYDKNKDEFEVINKTIMRKKDFKTPNKVIRYEEIQIDESSEEGLKNKAEKSGVSVGILRQVYKRGVAAWRTGHRPGTTPQQWGMARVNSFLTGGKTRTTADADLWKKAKTQKEELSHDKYTNKISVQENSTMNIFSKYLVEAKADKATIAKLKKMGGEEAEMAAFLLDQGDMKELNKFMKSLSSSDRKKIQSVMEEKEYFMTSHDYKGTKHTYKRRGPKMTDPIVVYIDGKEWKTFKSMPLAKKEALKYIKGMKEEVNITESKFDVYHKDFTSAVQHARKQAEKRGYTIDDDEWFRNVASGPRKPGTGKTNSYNIELLDKNGKPTKKKLSMQVYNTGKSYELNMYTEELQIEQNDTSEKVEMAQTQLHFIGYACDEILEFIRMGGEIEEWYQNKLSKVHSDMEGLHSYIEGEMRRTGMKEEVSAKDEKQFHNKLDNLVHKYFGDSPDEEKMKKNGKEVPNRAPKDETEVKEEKEYFIAGHDYKGTKHKYMRRGNKMTDPIVVYIDGKEWKTFKSMPLAKKEALKYIKGMKEETDLDEGMGKYTHYIIKDSNGKVKHHQVVADESGNEEMEHLSYLRKSVMKAGDKIVSFDMKTKSKKDALKHKSAVSMKEEVDLDEGVMQKIKKVMTAGKAMVPLTNALGSANEGDLQLAKNFIEKAVKITATTSSKSENEIRKMYYNTISDNTKNKAMGKVLKAMANSMNEEVEIDEEKNITVSFHSAAAKRKWLKKQGISPKEIIKQSLNQVELPASMKQYAQKKDHDEIYSVTEAKFSVDIEGLPRFYMDSDSPSKVKTALRTILKKPAMIKDVERAPESKVKADFRNRASGKEQVDEAKIAPDMIKKLRAEYGKIQKIDPSSETYKKLKAFITGMDKDQLQAIADANIKWLSMMAQFELKKK